VTALSHWTALTVLSASVLLQACAGMDSEEETDEIEQALDEIDAGGVVAGMGGTGGSTVGGIVGGTGGSIGGFLAGTAGGTMGGPVPFDGGVIPADSGASSDAGRPIDGGFIGGGDGGFIGGPPVGPQPFANWKFDDCGPSTVLFDSSRNQAHAMRSAQVACAEGISGGAVIFDAKKDTVVASAQPAFGLSSRMAVAAWIHPKNVSQGSLVTKALNGTHAFELVLNNGNLIFRININNGRKIKQIVSKAPISANRWTHVAAQYDGSFVRLFEDGVQVGQIAASGLIADVDGPIEVGNNQSQTFLRGRIDEVWLSTDPVSATDIANMSCIRAGSSIAATPFSSGPQELGSSFTYDVAITNRDVGACGDKQFFVSSNGGFIGGIGGIGGLFGGGGVIGGGGPVVVPPVVGDRDGGVIIIGEIGGGGDVDGGGGVDGGGPVVGVPPGVTAQAIPGNLSLPPGTTQHVSFVVSSSTDAEPGTFLIPVNAFSFNGTFESLDTQVEYILKEPTGCFVRTGRELMIRDLSVVEDKLRTTFDGPADDPRTGAWTFGRIMEQLAASDAAGPDMVEHVFNTWLTDQTINTFAVPAKPSMRDLVLNTWPRSPDGKLDLKRAPLRLLAIVNRIDSRNLAQGHAGEGRFVFGILDPDGFQTEFTMIFEFRLPAKTPDDVIAWANRWHALGSLPFPSETYNAALQDITDAFSRRGSEPGRPNNSALAQFRSNEIALTNSIWELREFELSATTNQLEPSTVKLTPDTSFQQGSPLVASYVNQNEASILLEQHVVPEVFEGQRFLGGSSFNDLFAWTAPGINNNEARHKYSLNTCNGCHSIDENGTAFLHVFPREPGQQSSLSGFLTGITVSDPVTGAPRSLNDLGRRNTDLKQLACPAPAAAAARSATTSSASAARDAFIAKGIDRTH
jgi:hypothetical protein